MVIPQGPQQSGMDPPTVTPDAVLILRIVREFENKFVASAKWPSGAMAIGPSPLPPLLGILTLVSLRAPCADRARMANALELKSPMMTVRLSGVIATAVAGMLSVLRTVPLAISIDETFTLNKLPSAVMANRPSLVIAVLSVAVPIETGFPLMEGGVVDKSTMVTDPELKFETRAIDPSGVSETPSGKLPPVGSVANTVGGVEDGSITVAVLALLLATTKKPPPRTMLPTSVVPPTTGDTLAELPLLDVAFTIPTARTVMLPCTVGTPLMENRPSAAVVDDFPPAVVTVAPATGFWFLSRTRPITVVPGSGITLTETFCAVPIFPPRSTAVAPSARDVTFRGTVKLNW